MLGLIFFREKVYNLIGLVIGIGLFLYCQNLISFKTFYVYIIPAIILTVGLKFIIISIFPYKANKIIKTMKNSGVLPEICRGIFFNLSMDFEEEKFQNAEVTAFFGNVICDLSKTIIEDDRALKVLSVFGNVYLDVPNNVNVVVRSSSIFGGVSNKIDIKDDAPNIYVSCTCVFGVVKIISTNHEFEGPWVL